MALQKICAESVIKGMNSMQTLILILILEPKYIE